MNDADCSWMCQLSWSAWIQNIFYRWTLWCLSAFPDRHLCKGNNAIFHSICLFCQKAASATSLLMLLVLSEWNVHEKWDTHCVCRDATSELHSASLRCILMQLKHNSPNNLPVLLKWGIGLFVNSRVLWNLSNLGLLCNTTVGIVVMEVRSLLSTDFLSLFPFSGSCSSSSNRPSSREVEPETACTSRGRSPSHRLDTHIGGHVNVQLDWSHCFVFFVCLLLWRLTGPFY